MRIVWSPLADSQVDAAMDYIAVEHPVAALAWLERLLEQVSSLGTFPDLGHVVPELQRDEIRELLVEPYRVIYRRGESLVEIPTVRHERRDLCAEDVGG